MGSDHSTPLDKDIHTLFSSSKITNPFDFNADFLIRLTPPLKIYKKRLKPYNQGNDRRFKDFQSHVFAFISKKGEFTVLSSVLPEILYHAILGETVITSVCSFHPSNVLLASAINRNSIIAATFNFLEEDKDTDSNSLYDPRFEFLEIKGIESPQLVVQADNDSFLVANTKSSLYILNMKKYISNQSNDLSNQYEKIVDSPQPSEPTCLTFLDGYIALSTCSGLLICKISPSKSSSKTNDRQKNAEYGIQYIPCSLFYTEFANAHNLTFIKINETSVLLFFISSNRQSVKYIRINDITNIREDKDSKKNIIQLHISIDEPVEIFRLNLSYIAKNKNEIFVSDLIHPETKSNNENNENDNKTIIFSCGREIFSFTPSLSLFSTSKSSNSKSNPILLTEKVQIQTNIQVKIQNANQDSNLDKSNDTKTYSCFNSIVKLISTSEPRVFAALFIDGTVVICRHPPYISQGNSKDNPSVSTSIETSILFNYHRCKPILSCIADDFSFLTFDENHVAILWESFPDWWSAPYCLKMFGINDNEEENNEYDNTEEDFNEDAVEDHD